MKDTISKKIKKYHKLNKGIVRKPNLACGTHLKLAASIPLVLFASASLTAQDCEADIANTQQILPVNGGMGAGFDFDVNGADGPGNDFRIFDEPISVSHAIKIRVLNPNLEILVNSGSPSTSAYAERHTATASNSFPGRQWAGTGVQPIWLNVGINGSLGEWQDAHSTPSYIIFRDKNTGFLGFIELIYDWIGPNHTVTMLSGGLDIDGGSIQPGVCASLTLPVELVDFKAAEKEGQVELNWMTVSETENAGFDVERSEDGIAFRTISFVEGNGTTTDVNKYSLMDKEVKPGVTYYYRLKQIDYNGKFDYSGVETVRLHSEATIVSEIYPNPSEDYTFHLSIDANENNTWKVHFFNNAGVLVSNELRNIQAGATTQTFSFENLTDGMYVLKLDNGTERIYRKVVVTSAHK